MYTMQPEWNKELYPDLSYAVPPTHMHQKTQECHKQDSPTKHGTTVGIAFGSNRHYPALSIEHFLIEEKVTGCTPSYSDDHQAVAIDVCHYC